MNAVALVESEDHVCVRYRLTAFRSALGSHTLHIESFAPTLFSRIKQYQSLSQFDAVVLQRSLLSPFELHLLRAQAKRLIFDYDDAIWLRDSYAMKGASRKRLRRFRSTIQVADQIFAGNEFLAANAARFTTRDRIEVVPSCVDVSSYQPQAKPARPLQLVWVGSSSTLKSLEAIRPTLEAIGQNFPGVRLKIICDRFANFDPLPVDCVPWNAASEAVEIASADVGIAIMPDDDWSRGKCGVKVLQYLAAGLPVIANPVGVHTAMVWPNETGCLASTTEDWLAAMHTLSDSATRQKFGTNGRRLAEANYDVSVGAAAWREFFNRSPRRMAC